jgi:hypothetical protein
VTVPAAASWESVPRWLRRAISCWLLFHIASLASTPLAVPPSSQLFQNVWQIFQPYLQALYLSHGFHYFAPEPGESTLVAFTVERANGATIHGIMPHRRIWPRLLYHRHFMLTESLFAIPEQLRELWHESYARCLARQYGGQKVHLTRVRHDLPSPQMVRDGVLLDHPESYERSELGIYERDAP